MTPSKILIVEDERISAEAIKKMLQKLGYVVSAIVATGFDAIKAVETDEPDLILMDIKLRGRMDGIEAASQIRERFDMPLIYLTAYADEQVLERAKITEPYGYIVKPIFERELHSNIEMALYKSRTDHRIKRLSIVLDTIRNINQLIIRETDRDRLLEPICHILIKTRGYRSGLLVILDKSGKYVTHAQAGLGERFNPMVELFNRDWLPLCGREAISQSEVLIVDETTDICADCPLKDRWERRVKDECGRNKVLAYRLASHGTVYGFMVVNLPEKIAVDTAELSLYQEVADDIGFALHSAESEEKRKSAEQERALHVKAIEQVGDAIVITDQDANIQYVNPAFEKVSGYSQAEAISQNLRILQSGRHDPSFYRQMWKTISSGKTWQGHLFNKKKDDTIFEDESTISPITDKTGNIINYVAVKRDVTEKVEIERQLQQMQKLEAIGSLAAGIAHDFNNILTPILGFAEMVLEQLPANSQIRKFQDEVVKAGLRAQVLVQQILTFSRREEQVRRPLLVQSVIKEALKLLRASIPSTIEINQVIDLKCGVVLADPTQFQQIIMNLCTNAYHAMLNRGGVLGISLVPVELSPDELKNKSTLKPGPYIKLEVSDTGDGMDRDVLERIFEPYFTTKEKGVGTGLGLSIVHGIVKSYGGIIQVSSEPGKGTTFQIYLPVIETMEDTAQPMDAKPMLRGNETILVLDDEEAIMRMERQMLESLGYKVKGFVNSEEALWAFSSQPQKFDLVITDMTMPHMTGTQLAQKILRIRADMPIILCSGFSELIDEEKTKSLNIREYLMKPIKKRELADIVRKVLQKEHNPETDTI